MTTQQAIAQFLTSQGIRPGFTTRRPVRNPFAMPLGPQPSYTAESLGHGWVDVAEFKALRLGTFLSTPDGQLIADGVGLVIPPMYQIEYQLAVAALTHAAKLQQQQGRKEAGQFTLVAVGAIFALFLISKLFED